MKVCFDTNVVIDILGQTDDFLDSYAACDICLIRGFTVLIPITSTTDVCYIMPRRDLASGTEARELLSAFLEIAEVIDARAADVRQALASDMPDHEDALLAYMALRQGVDLIVTRNKQGFVHSPVPVMAPSEFVRAFKQVDVDYTVMTL